MLTPTTTGDAGPRRRRASSRLATASAPSLLKPIRLTTARSSGRRNSRGRGLPGCASPVTVPTSTNEKPSAARASIPSAFLSKPAASPRGPGKVSPMACTCEPEGPRGSRASTGRPARSVAKPTRWAVSASTRVKAWSKTQRYAVTGSSLHVGADHRRPVREGSHPDVLGADRLDALDRRAEPLDGRDARDVGQDGRRTD